MRIFIAGTRKPGIMLKRITLLLFAGLLLGLGPSCNHNKIACPTYADSFPELKKKKKKGDTETSDKPQLPPVTKPRLSIAPPGYKN